MCQIRSNTIRATISNNNTQSPIVTFQDNDMYDQSPRALAELDELAYMTGLLEKHLSRANKQMALMPEYLSKVSYTVQKRICAAS
jgi:hypothetical protein